METKTYGSITITKVEDGKDGSCIEYVYYLSTTAQTSLSVPSYTDGTLTTGWTTSPQGISETYKYEYMSMRTKPSGTNTSWSVFSNPVIWSKWGEKGQDGDGVSYKYYLKNNATPPSYLASDTKWKDDPIGVSESNKYEYVVQIKTAPSTLAKKINTHLRNFPQSGSGSWEYYGTIGHQENWTTGTAYDNSHISVGDFAYIVGKVSSDEEPKRDARIYGKVIDIADNHIRMTSVALEIGDKNNTVLTVPSNSALWAKWGEKGDPGAPVEVDDQIAQYCLGDIPTGNDAPSPPSESDSGWSTTMPNPWEVVDGKKQKTHYVWQRHKVFWSNDQVTYVGVTMMDDYDVANILAQQSGYKNVGEWCKTQNVTIIDGSTIMTGTIAADRIDINDLLVNETFSVSIQGSIDGAIDDMVGKDNVITSINASTEGVSIRGSKVDITGNATFSSLTATESGKTVIDGGKIKAHSIAASQINTDGLQAEYIQSSNYRRETEEISPDYTGFNVELNNNDTYSISWDGTTQKEEWVIPAVWSDGISITLVPANAFSGCSQARSFYLPNSITQIGKGAFSSCDSLSLLRLPFIGGSANATGSDKYFSYIFGGDDWEFEENPELPTPFISDGIVEITNKTTIISTAFYGATLTLRVSDTAKVTFNYGWSSGVKALEYEGSLNDWNANITYNDTYFDTSKIQYGVPLSEKVFEPYTKIGDVAEGFKISSKEELMINSPYFRVTQDGEVTARAGEIGGWKITTDALYKKQSGSSSGMSSVGYVSSISDGFVYSPNADGKTCTLTSVGTCVDTDIHIPTTVEEYSITAIGNEAFYGCSTLVSVTIPDCVTSIGDSAFSGCSNLKSITIPNSVVSIGESAFEDCDALTTVVIPDSVTSIGSCAFIGCENLIKVIFGYGVVNVGYWVFAWCNTNLTIYCCCEESQMQNGWSEDWNFKETGYSDRFNTIWGYVPNHKVSSLVNEEYSYPRFFAGSTVDIPNFVDDAKFMVLEDGSLYANAANISGNVVAETGSIGNMQLEQGSLIGSDLSIFTHDINSVDEASIQFKGNSGYSTWITENIVRTTNIDSLGIDSTSIGCNYIKGKDGRVDGARIYVDNPELANFSRYSYTATVSLDNENKCITVSCSEPLKKDHTFNITYAKFGYSTRINGTIVVEANKSSGTFGYQGMISNVLFDNGAAECSFEQTHGTSRSIGIVGDLLPCDPMINDSDVAGRFNIGSSTRYWGDVYTKDYPTGMSDRNKKNTIQPLSDAHDQIFDALRPVSYKFNENTSNRTHTGLIAQDVKEAVENAGLTTQDFAAYCEWDNEDGSTGCGLRYGEFISLCIDQIQKLKKRVEELEEKLNNTQ